MEGQTDARFSARVKRRVLDLLAPLALRVWSGLLAPCSYGTTRFIGNVIGDLFYLLGTRAARTTETNLQICFPELNRRERLRLTRESLRHTGRLLAESGLTGHWSETELEGVITAVEGTAPLQEAWDAKRGILVLAPHFGNWELFALHFGRYGFMALYDPLKPPALDALIRTRRERTGASLRPIDARGVRSIFQALKQGRPVSILPDQVPPRPSGIHVPFFGRPALTMTFAHRLTKSTQPLVVLGSCRREKNGFRIVFSELSPEIYADDETVAVAAMNAAIEELVRQDPAQYHWEYKRFKSPPAGVADPYRA